MTLDGIEILLVQPDFAQPPRMTGRRGISMFARGQARRFGMFPTGGVPHVLAHRYAFTSRTAAREFENFFNARKGRHGGFLAPGWHAELEPKQTLEEGDTELAIGQVNYAAVYLDTAKKARTGHYIYLLNEAGDFHASKVLSATTGATEILTLRDAVPEGMSFQLGRYHVGFLYHARFMSDALALDFAGPEFVTCETSLIELLDGATPSADEVTPADDSGPTGGSNGEAGSEGNHYWLRCESPITTPPYGCPASASAELTLPAGIGGPREVEIRVRGLFETKGYVGGTASGFFYSGGEPDGSLANTFKLTVGSQVFFLNYQVPGGGNAVKDYTKRVTLAGGDTIRLEYDSVDALEYNNSGGLTVPGVPPYPAAFDGQFAQVDFTL